jgi:hypothetical protein
MKRKLHDDDGGNEGDEEVEPDEENEEEEDEEDAVRSTSKKRVISEANGDDESDPLEAFMSELDATDNIVPQESVNALPSRDIAPPLVPTTSSNTITLDELMTMTINSHGGEGWESDTRSHVAEDTDDESPDEETLDKDRLEFMQAIRSMHEQPQPIKRGQDAAADVADVDAAQATITTGANGRQDGASAATLRAATEEQAQSSEAAAEGSKAGPQLGRMWASEGDVMEEHEREEQERSALDILQEAIKKKELPQVDHTLVEYMRIRKNLYVVPRAVAHLAKAGNASRLAEARERMGIKVRGKGCPPPVETWEHCGLPDIVLRQLRRVYGDDSAPFVVQKQGLPAIMSGRDVIGIAKTGSGKTLAFLLPMIRHILDQPRLGDGEGPIGLIMVCV